MKGISQAALARKLGYVREALEKWERGVRVPSWRSLMDWCDALEVELVVYERN
jgi:transcriptional regulator with XRE-family HTH domain